MLHCYRQTLLSEQVLDNTKAQKETLEMFTEVGNTKQKSFSAGFPARNKQSPRVSAGNHNRVPLRQHFGTQEQQRWQRNTTSQTTNKSNGKTPETSGNYLLQHFSRTSYIEKLEHVHPLVKKILLEELKQNVLLLEGRISNFFQS